MSERGTYAARLVDKRALADDVLHLTLDVPGAERFDFTPGQHVCLSVGPLDCAEDRFYSIASPPGDDNRFELCVAVTDDAAGRALCALSPGAELRCWGPSGDFVLREPLRDSLFIATGTGVAPLRSMIHSILNAQGEQGRRIALLQGARTLDRLFYADEMDRLAALRRDFDFWPTLTRANGDWVGRRGRVLLHLADALSGGHHETDVYVCGQPDMVAEVSQALLEAGLDSGALFYEKY